VNEDCEATTNDVEQLVKSSQTGDRGAFDQLVRLYQHRAIRLAVGILGDAEEAAEAVQAGFVKAYLGINKLKEPTRFETWLLRIISNAAISQRRTAERRKSRIRTVDCNECGKAVLPADKGIAEELKGAIQKAMSKLSKKEARAISLFGLEDLSQEQAAEIMGCSTEAVRWYVFKARKKLKVLLKEYLE